MTAFSRLLCCVLVSWMVVGLTQSSQEDETCLANGTADKNKNEKVACSDEHEHCEFWASLVPSECDTNPDFMHQYCKKSCNICGSTDENLAHRIDSDPLDLGVPQRTTPEREKDVQTVTEMTIEYMKNEVLPDPEFANIWQECKNRHPDCVLGALQGACDEFPGYMLVNCAPTCQSCDQLAYEKRCPMDQLDPDAWEPGDLNKMFEKITTADEYQKYSPKILSRPKKEEAAGQTEDYPVGPWVITLDDFVSPEECDRLIQLGHDVGYERSWDVGKQNADGSFERSFSEGRTSTTAWCRDSCYEDPVARNVMDRIATLTGIPEPNSEYLQLLKYQEGEYYNSHHDLNPFQVAHQPGVRLLTVFLYLNDVEQGGGTDFPKLGLTVMPKRGRVLIWPSVLDRNPSRKDGRTTHQALPVEKGVKYGANAWIHLRNFKQPLEENCQ